MYYLLKLFSSFLSFNEETDSLVFIIRFNEIQSFETNEIFVYKKKL